MAYFYCSRLKFLCSHLWRKLENKTFFEITFYNLNLPTFFRDFDKFVNFSVFFLISADEHHDHFFKKVYYIDLARAKSEALVNKFIN